LKALKDNRGDRTGLTAWNKGLTFNYKSKKYNFKELFNFKKLAYVFIASGLCQSFIAISQYVQQKSLGLKFLAESPLNPEIAGVAKNCC